MLAMHHLSRHRVWSTVVVAAVALVTAVGYTANAGFPLPGIHDEMSYVLAADMYARGHVSMPAADSPGHFETIHVLQQPRYVSKYPPGQGLALAAGVLLADSPRFGVWLSFVAFAVALLWMLRAWLPARWSLVAAVLLILHLAATNWTYSYWGGAVGALGGALVLGAFPRVIRRARAGDAVLLGLGLVVLANSRPFEGLLLSVPIAIAFASWLVTDRRHSPGRRWLRGVLPAGTVVALGSIAMLAFNRATTGDPLRSPYAEYERQKGGASVFVWGRVAPLHANARATDIDRWNADAERHSALQSARGYLRAMWHRWREVATRLFPPALPLVVLFIPWLARSRLAPVLSSVALVAIGLSAVAWFEAHYLSPVVAGVILLYIQSVRLLRVGLARRMGWRSIARIGTAMFLLVAFGDGIYRLTQPPVAASFMKDPRHWARQRFRIADELRSRGGRHVVFVRYTETYNSSIEWVYNGADLNNEPVLWANDLGDVANAKLLSSQRRQGWLLVLPNRHNEVRTVLPYPTSTQK